MPRYTYNCNQCNQDFQIWHGMKEMQESCQICNKTGCLTKIPQPAFTPKETAGDVKVGTTTKKFIDDNREILSEMKKEARRQIYED
jgi:putative FmdB family regulatory protein